MSWFEEAIHPEIRQSIRIDRVIFEGQTDFQNVSIFDNNLLGRVLVLDDAVQITEFDEHIYSESMVHVPMVSHPAPKRVLIIGAGDGTVLREVLKHEALTQVTMVEIDGALVKICHEHLSDILHGAFDDPRLNLIIGDGAKYLRESDQEFDVIIIDSTDPDDNSTALFTNAFYGYAKARLAKGGIIVAQAGCPAYQPSIRTHMNERMHAHFTFGGFYHAAVPTYIGGLHAFSWASDAHDLNDIAETNLKTSNKNMTQNLSTRYYTERSHKAAFYMEACR
ncbi:polyamine aminopropyltransferase [Kiloniella antarctica]|uniref:Polyamine aminopropyltransferase n=1 Tax=Kiloniella antarctica TaxID=1550907 RepID=A0ABW5BL83_9PROT